MRILEALEDMSLSNAAREEIEAAVRHAEETGQVVQAHHQLLAALKRHGLIREGVQLEPDQIACLPLNRDGFGLSWPDIQRTCGEGGSGGME